MGVTTSIPGIVESDLLIKSALEAAFADLRKQPWRLDYCFAWLDQDALTRKMYGDKEAAKAKRWFLDTEVPVVLAPRLDEPKMPCITIQLMDGSEAETTLADVNSDTEEDAVDLPRPVVVPPFAPTSYDPATGTVTMPAALSAITMVFPGMSAFDAKGAEFPILEVPDDSTFTVQPGASADFSQMVIKGPPQTVTLESEADRQVYVVGVHTEGPPAVTIHLHTVVKFCLLAYKQSLLEARGFERSSIKSTDLKIASGWEQQAGFTRNVILTGYVRDSWPKDLSPKIAGLIMETRVSGGGAMARTAQDLLDAPWLGDQDPEPALYGGPTVLFANPAPPLGSPFVFFGGARPGTYDDSFVLVLPDEVPSAGRQRYLTMSAGPADYYYYAFPASYGAGAGPQNFTDASNGQPLPFSRVAYGVPVADPGTGGTLSYDLWRSDQPNLGTRTVQVR